MHCVRILCVGVEVAMLAEQAGMHDDNGFTNSSDTGG